MAKNGSYNLYAYTKKEYDLTGIITVEARVKRITEFPSANQFGMYSFNKADFKTGDPTSSSNAIGTFALSKGNIITHNKKGSSSTVNVQTYEKGKWDIIRNVINLDTNTFDFSRFGHREKILTGSSFSPAVQIVETCWSTISKFVPDLPWIIMTRVSQESA